MKNTRFLFWVIVFLTIAAILIDMPREFTIAYESPQLPVINKKISFKKTIYGLGPQLGFGPAQFTRDLSFKKGLDLAGGTSITLRADMKNIPDSSRKDVLEATKAVLERRIDPNGTLEPLIQTAQSNRDSRIIVELPGITDVKEAIRKIGTTALLTFWEEGSSQSAKVSSISAPLDIEKLFQHPVKTNLTGKDLRDVNVGFNQTSGQPEIQLNFTPEGAKKFAEITKKNVNKIVVIALDNQIIQAPRVNQPIETGDAVISGSFTLESAKEVKDLLKGGSLPVPLSILEQRTIGATLGEESLKKSLFAGVVGFIVIVVFMVVLYGKLGWIASLSLVLYTLFVLALFKLIPITLTLAGIAGFILSIGMAVDANILIFERMKEETRRGKPRDIAIELGFSRAWTSIRDSNVSSIITSLILIYFGTGIVRGFALTLLIGVLVSMFSAITVTRTFLRLVYK